MQGAAIGATGGCAPSMTNICTRSQSQTYRDARQESWTMASSASISQTSVDASAPRTTKVVRKHHLLVRIGHWCALPLLLGLILSGISIYWSSPIFQHATDPTTGNFDDAADIGIWLCAHVPWMHNCGSPPDWVYNHFSLGPGMLAQALRLHWFCAYLFMADGLVYLIGLVLGGGWRGFVPKSSDAIGALRMTRFYIGLPFAWILGRRWPHPPVKAKYNALQKISYGSVIVAGVLVVASGWGIHKPAQLSFLAKAFGGYNAARVWHFGLMCFFIVFVVPHVVLVLADGWDTMRSMIVGWSVRLEPEHDAEVGELEAEPVSHEDDCRCRGMTHCEGEQESDETEEFATKPVAHAEQDEDRPELRRDRVEGERACVDDKDDDGPKDKNDVVIEEASPDA